MPGRPGASVSDESQHRSNEAGYKCQEEEGGVCLHSMASVLDRLARTVCTLVVVLFLDLVAATVDDVVAGEQTLNLGL